MDFEEHVAKRILAEAGVPVPQSELVTTPEEARQAAARLGHVVVKAQVAAGKRGKAGGIRFADSPEAAESCARDILALTIGGFQVQRLLIEERVALAAELYLAILDDADARAPAILFSTSGGMEIEDVAARNPQSMHKFVVDMAAGVDRDSLVATLGQLDLPAPVEQLVDFVVGLYSLYCQCDAELLEINPLGVTTDGGLVALDCKLSVDDAAAVRQPKLAALAAAPQATALETEAAAIGLKYLEMGGSVGVLANGAGLTMTTMDAIAHFGGSASNFLEIGGEAYTKAEAALRILLKNPNIRCLLVNFCGAYARTDVMARGVVDAWKALRPDIPVFFTIHGTGEDEAVALVEAELGIKPFDLMDDAVSAAVRASEGGR